MRHGQAAFRVLQAIRVRGRAGTRVLEEIVPVGEEELGKVLADLEAAGAIHDERGSTRGWRLTDEGIELHASLLQEEAGEMDRSGWERLSRSYAEFLELDVAFKQVCGDWQLRSSSVANEHDDVGYDALVIARLGAIHTEATALCLRLARQLDRFDRYRHRLSTAMARIDSGDVAAFTRPLSSSYHDIWMELHEDLLVTLHLPRPAADA